jgi:hypothetical protein
LIRTNDEVNKINEAKMKEKDKIIGCLTNDIDISMHKLNERDRRIIEIEENFNNLNKEYSYIKQIYRDQENEIMLLRQPLTEETL